MEDIRNRDLAIATAATVNAKRWANGTTTYEKLKERLSKTLRTTETVAEYQHFLKDQKDVAKDHGGFVLGYLDKGRRTIESVQYRDAGAIDSDEIDQAFLTNFADRIPYTFCFYTTHGHTPENPRVRIVVPFTRSVTPEEYNAIIRYLAEMVGIDSVDICSFKVNQLMFFPSTPSDGEFIFKAVDDREWLDPDKFLSEHPGWDDPLSLPRSEREAKAYATQGKKAADPLTKEGIVGYFCRAYYPVQKALETFLSDVYEPTDDEARFHLIGSSHKAGVEIKENDKFVYSHHATDVACSRLCNAFDIVRLHKFGDDKKSYDKMAEFAGKDENVKLLIARERDAWAKEEFKVAADDEVAEAAKKPKTDDRWKKRLTYYQKTDTLENTVENELLILTHDPDFRNFGYNEMAHRVEITGPVPWDRPTGNSFWRDADTAQLKACLDIRYGVFSERNHTVAFTKVADDRRFHPVRDYLDHLPKWDGTPRVDRLFIDRLQADDTDYVKAVTRKTLCAAVARIYHPGIKSDTVCCLDGAQGIGKSSIWNALAGDKYFSDALSLTDMNDKSAAEKLQGFWILEIGELSGMRKADIEKVKSFISSRDDKYRPSYGHTVESHPRQCIIVATVNGERGYLRDITGNRRFWIVKCHQENAGVNWAITPELRDQVWAEAKYYYEQGETLYLTGDLLAKAEEAQRGAMEVDDRKGIVENYLQKPLPDNWASMDLVERRSYLDGDPTSPKGTIPRTEVSNAEIWSECFGKNLADMKPSDSYAIAALMLQIGGWKRTQHIRRLPIYGRQKIYAKEG